jgi:TolB protein
MTALRRFSPRLLASMPAVAVVACGGKESTAPPGPTSSAIALVAGDNQTGVVGEALAQPLVVKVTDPAGAGAAGVTVTWLVTAGGGSLSTMSTQTDTRGQAQVTWTLGTRAGTNSDATSAGVSGSSGTSVRFVASARPAPPAKLSIVSGNPQAGFVAEPLAPPPSVQGSDRFGNAVPAVTVGWTVTSGAGTVSAPSTETDSSGLASVRWTLGGAPGANELEATVAGVTPVSLTATGVFPGSGKIAFPLGSDIYIMNPNGTGVSQLTHTADVSVLALSLDGSRIALVRTIPGSPGWGIYTMGADGSGVVRVTAPNTAGYGYSSLSWSPDGTRIAFDRIVENVDDIYVMSADGTGLQRVTDSTALRDEPTWSPDGLSVAFRVFGPGCWAIDAINLDGTGLKALTNCVPQSHQDFFDPAWSPDGKTIALAGPQSATDSDSTSIYLMNKDGSGLTRLTNAPGVIDRGPVWSPDGSKIAFVRTPWNNVAASLIYTMNADGTGVVLLRAGGSPTWSR